MAQPNERQIMRIQGVLHRIGDCLFIPDLKSNGTIVKFTNDFVVLQQHCYSCPVRRAPRNLRLEGPVTISAEFSAFLLSEQWNNSQR